MEQPTAEDGVPAKNTDIADKSKFLKQANKKPSTNLVVKGAKKAWDWITDPKESAEDEDAMVDNDAEEKKPSLKELAEWVGAFYNKDYKESGFESPWRKGVTELSTMAEKQFGHPYGHLVEKMVSEFSETPLERIAREGGVRNAQKEEADDLGMGSSASNGPLTQVDNPHLPKGPEEADDHTGTGKMMPKESVEDMNFRDIMRLAGLAK